MLNFFKPLGRKFMSSDFIVSTYYRLFRPLSYKAYIDYRFSDEKLKFLHLLETVNYCKVAEMPQVYFEFGCHSARTFSAVVRAAEFLKMHDMKFYAFDSFEGLPTTNVAEDGVFQTGEFATPISEFKSKVRKMGGKDISDEYIIKGFYSESLTAELQAKMPKVGAVHIDVDLYSSTKEVFAFLRPLFTVGTVILFDDYYCFAPDGKKGEMRALFEYCDENPEFKVKEWKSYSTFGQSFFVTSC